MLAGVVAGTLTASTAFRPAPEAEGATAPTVAAAAVALPAPADPPEPAPAPPVGDLRRSEAAVEEWVHRVRIAELARETASRATNTPGSLIRPVPGAVTGLWAEQRRTHRHAGIDYDGDTGDPVAAAGSGVVVHAGGAPAGYSGYGLMVMIDHGGGVSTLYAHLSRVGVRVGDIVGTGDHIGAIGTTGNVTGSHLHFEVRFGGRPVNPNDWIAG